MSKKKWILLGFAVPVVGVTWWLGSPLFVDEAVDERFPMSALAELPEGMTRADAEAEMALAAEQSEPVVEPMPAAVEPSALRSGAFRDVDRLHRGSGTSTIYELPDGTRVLRLENFEVTNGPDLRVLLAVHPDPRSRSDLDGGGYVELSALKGNIGNQNYEIPGDLDPSDFGSIVIYCRPFHVLFSVAPLE